MNLVKYNFESLIMSPFLKSQFVYYSLSLSVYDISSSFCQSSRFCLHIYPYTHHKREETPDRSSNPKKWRNKIVSVLQ